jgi:oxygen-independent coproporphyrinogen-3 oxidase
MKEWALRRDAAASGAAGRTAAVPDAVAASGARWETVYFGGGTPTYLDEDILAGLIGGLLPDISTYGYGASGLLGTLELSGSPEPAGSPEPPCEFTVEANPGTLTMGKLDMLGRTGCGRLSIGAQSFDDSHLAWLGRSHTADEFMQAWDMARGAGFANMNLDLIYGLPGQSPAHWRGTLAKALACRPEHISLYQLNIEEGTPLAALAAAGQACSADEETCRRQYLLAHEALTDAGYTHYEISNYAKPGMESRHNTHCWRNGLYLGLGAGAAGYLPGIRYANKGDLESYLADLDDGVLPMAEREIINREIAVAEELMLAFRLREGAAKKPFAERWGFSLREGYGRALEKHLAAGLLDEDDEWVWPTLEGWLNYNSWIQDFL